MAISVEQFIDSLTELRLVDAEQARDLREEMETNRPADTETLSKRLVSDRLLTEFQAAALRKGQGERLTLGDYLILDEIGKGGMGRVLRARHLRMDREVAIKILADAALAKPDLVDRFRREVRAAAKLSHPNIVRAYDAGEQDGVSYLAMELIEGRDLTRVVASDGPLPIPRAIDYTTQAARGLQYAHSQGLIHRDVKPQNLLVDKQGVVRILDLGLARMRETAGEADVATHTDQIMGTVAYMAPEQAVDTHAADERSDIYSLGCTLFVLLTGRIPYPGATAIEQVLAHREAEVPSVCELRPDVPEELAAVVKRMMSKRPEDRLQKMEHVVAALASPGDLEALTAATTGDAATIEFRALAHGQTTTSPAARGPTSPYARGRSAWFAAVGGLLICVSAGIVAWQLWGIPPAKPTRLQPGESERNNRQRGNLTWVNGRADVLMAIDPVRDNWNQANKGKASFRGDTLVLPANSRVLVRYPFPDEYRLELKLKRLSAIEEPLLLMMAREGSLFGLVVGAPTTAGYASALQEFENPQRYAPSEEISREPILHDGVIHNVAITVTSKGVQVMVDESKVLDWQGGYEPFPPAPTMIRSVAFTTNLGAVEISKAEVVDLTTKH